MQTPTFRMNGTVIDPAEAVRSARDLQVPDTRDLLRGLDAVPGRVDTALGAAGDSLREAGDQLRGTIHEMSAPRRNRRLPIAWPLLVGLAVGAAMIGLGTWWFRRSTATPTFEDDIAGPRPRGPRPRRRRGHGHGARRDRPSRQPLERQRAPRRGGSRHQLLIAPDAERGVGRGRAGRGPDGGARAGVRGRS